jgi:hypothetical protein
MPDQHPQPVIRSTIPPAIAGWLLLFCVILTVVNPLASAYEVATVVMPTFFATHVEGVAWLLAIQALLIGGLAIFSVVAGLRLWLIKAGAVATARRFLWSYLLLSIAYFVLWIVVVRSNSTLNLAAIGFAFVARPIGFFAVWFSYLDHSKRVRETYSAELAHVSSQID